MPGHEAGDACRTLEPFVTTKMEGLEGLGLPIVQRFAEEADAQNKIESELEVGTTATLWLPISESRGRRLPHLVVGARPRQPAFPACAPSIEERLQMSGRLSYTPQVTLCPVARCAAAVAAIDP